MSLSQPELDLLENEEFQRKTWTLQRWTWWILGLFLLGAALGLTSSGGFTRARAEGAGGRIDWPRFARQGAIFELDVYLRGGSTIWISNKFLDRFEVVSVLPRPEKETAYSDRVVFETSRGRVGDARVRFWLKPVSPGWVEGTIGFSANDGLSLAQWVYY